MVDARAIEVELANKLGLELNDLELDNYISAKLEMVKEEVGSELIAINREDLLASYEREAIAKLQKELNYVLLEGELEVLLLIVLIEAEELEVVWVFEYVAREVSIRFWKGVGKVGECLPLCFVESAIAIFVAHHIEEHGARPLVLEGLVDVEEGFVEVAFDLCQYLYVVPPRDAEDGFI